MLRIECGDDVLFLVSGQCTWCVVPGPDHLLLVTRADMGIISRPGDLDFPSDDHNNKHIMQSERSGELLSREEQFMKCK